MAYYSDYPTEPIGGGNPYYRCAHCGRSDPEINGSLEKHLSWCEYRLAKEAEIAQAKQTKTVAPELPSRGWGTRTTYLQRFGDAMQLLCQGHRPSDDILEAWLFHENERLQEFACNNGPEWAQGIGLIDAAMVLADNPEEGHEHQTLEEAKAEREARGAR